MQARSTSIANEITHLLNEPIDKNTPLPHEGKLSNSKDLRKNFVQINAGLTQIMDGALLEAIFLLHYFPIIFAVLKPILFPIAPIIMAAKMTWSWVKVALENAKKAESIFDAIMASLSFAVVTTAVIFSFTVLAPFTPIIFTSIMALGALYEGGKTIYHLARATLKPEERKQELNAAKHAGISFAVGAILTAGIGGLMIAGVKAFIIVGATAAAAITTVGVIGTIVGVTSIIKNWRAKNKSIAKAKKVLHEEHGIPKHQLSLSTTQIQQRIATPVNTSMLGNVTKISPDEPSVSQSINSPMSHLPQTLAKNFALEEAKRSPTKNPSTTIRRKI